MRTYWNTKGGMNEVSSKEEATWIQVTSPNDNDINFLENEIKIPDYFLHDIADIDEQSRFDSENGWLLIILRIPYAKELPSRTPFNTVPLGIIINKNICVTVCNFATDMMNDFVSYQKRRSAGFIDTVDMVVRLFLSSAVWYLRRVKQIGVLIDRAKRNLDHKIDNADLISLSRLQDSLTYFITSLRDNEMLLSKLKFKLPIDELDADLIEDVNIEMGQAREMTNTYSNILESTMDTYANIINNNISNVMKMLTTISIILMFPTLVASIFGMNLINGMEQSQWGFPIAILISIAVTGAFWWYFKRKNWM